MKRIVIILILPLLCFSQYNIKGRVINDSKENLSYVSVAIKDSIKALYVSTTNEKGEFILENIKNGRYKIEIYLLGYKNKTIQINVDKDLNLGDIVLEKNEEILNDMELTSQMPLVESQGDKLVVNMLNNSLAKGRTVKQMLSYTPFMEVTSKSIKLLGSSPIVLINDRRMYMSGEELVNFLNSIPAQDIKNVEIYMNPPARFDAEGTSGVININISKQALIGIKGYVGSEVSFLTEDVGSKWGVLSAASGNGRISYRDESWYVSTYFKYDISNRPFFHNLISTLEYGGNGYNNSTIGYGDNRYSNFQFELGKEINKDHDVIINYRYNAKKREGQSNYVNSIFDSNKDINSIIKGEIEDLENSNVHMLGINYNWKINDKGEKMMLSMDYYGRDKKEDNDIKNKYFKPNNEVQERENNILTYLPMKGNIYAFQIDYNKPTDIGKFSFGVKYGLSNNDNKADYYDIVNGNDVINKDRTLDFKYEEGIIAGYLSYSTGSFKMGLRYEYTDAMYEDRKLMYGEDKSYGGFFPNISYTYPLFEKRDAVTMSYNRRINRPGYSDFNRLEYVSDNQLVIGTPEIKPAFPNRVQLMYNLMKKYIIIGEFVYTNGQISDISYQANDSLTVVQKRNIDNFYYFMLATNINQSISDWWDINFMARILYNNMNTKFNGVNDELIEVSGKGIMSNISLRNVFNFYKWNIELYASYSPESRYGYAKLLSRSEVNLSIRRDFLDNKLSIYLNINDIFKKNMNNMVLYSGNVVLDNKERTFTTIDFGFRYDFDFGRKNVKDMKINQSIEEEIQRM